MEFNKGAKVNKVFSRKDWSKEIVKENNKKKPYWIEVEEDYQSGYSYVMLKGKNRFDLSSDRYDEKSRANQQAKRLAKNLGLEFRQ